MRLRCIKTSRSDYAWLDACNRKPKAELLLLQKDFVISLFYLMSICCIIDPMTSLKSILMYGKEANIRKQEIDRQHHTIPNQRNQRPKDKHRGNVYNLLFRHGKVRSQNMEKLKCSFPTFCKQTFPQLHKIASYAHYAQCRLLRNPTLFCLSYIEIQTSLRSVDCQRRLFTLD